MSRGEWVARGSKEEHQSAVGKVQCAIELCPFTQSLMKNDSFIRLEDPYCNN